MMIIRDATKKELSFIRKQRVIAYSEHVSAISSEHWQALKQAISSDADEEPGVERIVAEHEGEIVGSVALFPAKIDVYEGLVDKLDYPEIRVLAVTPEHQGKGIASALISECVNRAKEKGFTEIGLHTGSFMKNAIRLYERMGFVRMPQYDFEPANDGVIVKAFRKSI